MDFLKMHGLKNDFIVIENLDNSIRLSHNQIAFLCERRAAIGADGLILISPSDKADIMMEYFNSDGARAQVCGNGLRCAAKYAFDNKIARDGKIFIESAGKIYECGIVKISGEMTADIVSVKMGRAEFEKSRIPVNTKNETNFDIDVNAGGVKITLSAVAMPNPHAVVTVKDFDYGFMEKVGRALQGNEMFPQKVNVNFAKINSAKDIELVTYERGVGITQACGSGACATGAVLHKKGLAGNDMIIKMPGGELELNISSDGEITMTGPAAAVYFGQINI
jgi:diaminopimelate epimerase